MRARRERPRPERLVAVLFLAAATWQPLLAQDGETAVDPPPESRPEASAAGEEPAPETPAESPVSVTYGSRGLEFRSADGDFGAWVGIRAQLRAAYPFARDPLAAGDFDSSKEVELSVYRARLKTGGHAFRPWLDYYLEYEILKSTLLDLRFTFERWDAFQVRIGQWKPEYNRERRDSSGELQLVDRSIANRVFTLDRQSGLMINGRLGEGTPGDSHYWLGALHGEGLGTFESGGTPLFMGRWQWNFTGRELGFTQSDIERKGEPEGSLAVAAARNRSRFTRFSQDGGGALDGFPADSPERYEIEQALVELAYHHRGLSFQAELHRKRIRDRTGELPGSSTFDGGYAQVGYFFHGLWRSFPEPLELALRFATVDGRDTPSRESGDELTLAGNWFFRGHRNKLTADVSLLALDEPGFEDDKVRFRLQWDISL